MNHGTPSTWAAVALTFFAILFVASLSNYLVARHNAAGEHYVIYADEWRCTRYSPSAWERNSLKVHCTRWEARDEAAN